MSTMMSLAMDMTVAMMSILRFQTGFHGVVYG